MSMILELVTHHEPISRDLLSFFATHMRPIISGIVAKAANDAISQQFPTFPWMMSAAFLVKTYSILWGNDAYQKMQDQVKMS